MKVRSGASGASGWALARATSRGERPSRSSSATVVGSSAFWPAFWPALPGAQAERQDEPARAPRRVRPHLGQLLSGLRGGYLSPRAIKRRSLKTQLLPPNSGYELPTTFIRGK